MIKCLLGCVENVACHPHGNRRNVARKGVGEGGRLSQVRNLSGMLGALLPKGPYVCGHMIWNPGRVVAGIMKL